ncbi:MAG: WbqC family protein [Sulfuricella sp.]|jgi:hypothetical protein
MTGHSASPLVAGHQPNFFPWFGYFEKMLKSDIFVFSDDVQYPKQSFVNRVEIPVNGIPNYLTLPVCKGDDKRIADKRYAKDAAILERLIKTVRINLGGRPHGRDIELVLDRLVAAFWQHETVAELNIELILFIASSLGINTPTFRGTALGLDEFRCNQRLIERCRRLGSTDYLSGQGADGYQDEAMLKKAGIDLTRVDYSVGRTILGAKMRYSILLGIAELGMEYLKSEICLLRETERRCEP